ncbi:MFS transporter [Streptomyces sp. CG1]|uniref:MFS transporter n=1 Tax=Streptomyces sp. CG1 TaxID=1287523 RepID=UPI0034E2A54F
MAGNEIGATSHRSPDSLGRGWTLAVVSAATFMLLLDLTVVNVALPDLRTAFDVGFTDLQWVLDAYALTLAVFLLTAGSLADKLGRKRIFTLGFVVFTLGSLVCGLAQDILVLNLARGVQGIGAAVLFAVGPALIGNAFHGKDRGKAFGVFGAVGGLAIAFGPLIGGALTQYLSWRWIFLLNVPVGLFAITAGALRIRESKGTAHHPVDWAGLVVFSGALGLLVTGFLRGHAEGWTSALILGMFAASVVLLVVFYLIERRRGETAMLDLSLFRIPTFNGISMAALMWNAAVLGSIFLEISYLQNALGLTAWETGLRFLPMTLTIFVAGGIGGSLTATVSPKLLASASGALMATGIGLMLLIDKNSSWTALLPSMIVQGIGMGIYTPMRAALSVGVAEPEKAGMASGIGETFQQVGIAVGIAGFGALFQSRVTDSLNSSQIAGPLGGKVHEFGEAVASGAGKEAVATLPGGLAARAADAAHAAFVSGLRDTMGACSALVALGTVLVLLTVRSGDLHESARGEQTAAGLDGRLGGTEEPVASGR